MQKSTIVIFITCLLTQPTPVAVAFEGACKDLPTQTELSQCSNTEMKKANTALNSIYKKLMAIVKGEEKTQLRAAERAWIDYRDKMCGFVGLRVEGGSMEGMVISLCHTELIEAQTRLLTEQLRMR